ncbi:MAG: ribosome silencing factor [Gemmatimonadetes bacterium]|uniref:Ribosomal silencing factor RsfS n=1 Tax=Candidatus Kutchimonas denitrificans TaxID=3056748 RepID=A0AAE4Z759_9BACT|nr:ribosome silencing factor [Gemmatimonadota bacterium]NIR74994.1 ribosome silencing factor [Candidatus Kutchimonas denitrificans]NIS01577.1 ribosome silencing factor [Gemmatimonadota bacterium]NIT67315.1 ribosome silencing factor [Gemmatimonadota bacterium]NIU52678.1 ribosome silencing factor [Gemmatimonadota bacterium]
MSDAISHEAGGGKGPLDPQDLPDTVRRAIDLCLERKAREPTVLDLRGLSDATDFFIVASGDSDVHVRAIAEHLVEELRQEGVRPAGVEGERAARWVLIDYIDLVVHLFHPVVRDFYQLERLWGDAPSILIEEPA